MRRFGNEIVLLFVFLFLFSACKWIRDKEAVDKYVTEINALTELRAKINLQFHNLRIGDPSKEVMIEYFESRLIPAYETYLDGLKKVSSGTPELDRIHQMRLSHADKELHALKLMLRANKETNPSLKVESENLIKEAEKLLEEINSRYAAYIEDFGYYGGK